jgi:hypothetical protein
MQHTTVLRANKLSFAVELPSGSVITDRDYTYPPDLTERLGFSQNAHADINDAKGRTLQEIATDFLNDFKAIDPNLKEAKIR